MPLLSLVEFPDHPERQDEDDRLNDDQEEARRLIERRMALNEVNDEELAADITATRARGEGVIRRLSKSTAIEKGLQVSRRGGIKSLPSVTQGVWEGVHHGEGGGEPGNVTNEDDSHNRT